MRRKTRYDYLICMLKFVNKSKNPVSKDELKKFGFSENEIEEFITRRRGVGGFSNVSIVQHISSTPILIEIKEDNERGYRLTNEGYKLLQDYWHIKASNLSSWIMVILTLVGIGLNWVLVSKKSFIRIVIPFLPLTILAVFLIGVSLSIDFIRNEKLRKIVKIIWIIFLTILLIAIILDVFRPAQ